MRSDVRYFTLIKDNYPVSIFYCRKPVSDNHGGPSSHYGLKRLLNDPLGD